MAAEEAPADEAASGEPEPGGDGAAARGALVSHRDERLTVTAPSPHVIVLTRAFAHPRRSVFDALRGPTCWSVGTARGWHLVVCESTCAPAGPGASCPRGPGARRWACRACASRSSRRSASCTPRPSTGGTGPAVVTTDLVEEGGRTSMTATVRYPSQRLRDAMLATNMARGVGEA